MRSQMQHQSVQPQPLAAAELDRAAANAALAHARYRRRQIDQIGGVGECGSEVEALMLLTEAPDDLGAEPPGRPLPVALDEYLIRVGSDISGAGRRMVDAAGNGYVGAETMGRVTHFNLSVSAAACRESGQRWRGSDDLSWLDELGWP